MLRNYSSMWAIWSAVQSPVLAQLPLTRKGLSQAEVQVLKEIDEIMSWTEGRKAYRSLLDPSKPCVPYLGAYVSASLVPMVADSYRRRPSARVQERLGEAAADGRIGRAHLHQLHSVHQAGCRDHERHRALQTARHESRARPVGAGLPGVPREPVAARQRAEHRRIRRPEPRAEGGRGGGSKVASPGAGGDGLQDEVSSVTT
jgi:hypothetical protein